MYVERAFRKDDQETLPPTFHVFTACAQTAIGFLFVSLGPSSPCDRSVGRLIGVAVGRRGVETAESKRNRNFDLTQCVMADVTNAVRGPGLEPGRGG